MVLYVVEIHCIDEDDELYSQVVFVASTIEKAEAYMEEFSHDDLEFFCLYKAILNDDGKVPEMIGSYDYDGNKITDEEIEEMHKLAQEQEKQVNMPPIPITEKKLLFGQSITTQELLEALQNPIFEDDAMINVHTPKLTDTLSLVYECKSCNSLHLMAGKLEKEVFNNEFGEQSIVYANKTYDDEAYISRRELISVLENLGKIMNVTIDHFGEEDGPYTLTGVYKCSEQCSAIHLTADYDEHAMMPN